MSQTKKPEVRRESQADKAQIVAVSGGKGGIGKTFFSVNLAVELRSRGYKVLVFDADVNLSNVSILLHIDETKPFMGLIEKKTPIDTLIQRGVGGVDAIYVGDDLDRILELDDEQYKTILQGLAEIESQYDFIIIDTSAGLDEFNAKLMVLADRIILLANPEATSVVDVYRVVKVMAGRVPGIRFELVVNKAGSAEGAARLYSTLAETISQNNIRTHLDFLGYVLEDGKRVYESIQKRTPLLILHSSGNLNECFKLLSDSFLKGQQRRRRFRFFYNLFGRS